MKTKVVYFTKSGHTETIAKAIAEELNTEASTIDDPLTEQVDILFLGASLYKMGIDKKVLAFVDSLDATKIGNVVLFSTSALSDSGYGKLKKRLEDKGISVRSEHFHCKGAFMLLNKHRPNTDDVIAAKKFASDIVQS
ncbi:flavodoxin domain-containing protein [Candidatus Epulonipiscium viviparus]|uniref:flavodoxin domain-containing protein n=1 Tax=Candidatus Epulonipiscium viviparus TaxID=420336 RepID=UPI0027380A70|nr:flavodoxin domain-containing protein [Candidatus Epulopiscium viviparus]